MKRANNPFKLGYSYLWALLELEIGSVVAYFFLNGLKTYGQIVLFFGVVLMAVYLLTPALLSRWVVGRRLLRRRIVSFLTMGSLAYGVLSILMFYCAYRELQGTSYSITNGVALLWVLSSIVVFIQVSIFILVVLIRYLHQRSRLLKEVRVSE